MPLARAPEKVFASKQHFVVFMRRGKKARKKVFTSAFSRAQAERFAKFRNPAYRVTQIKLEF